MSITPTLSATLTRILQGPSGARTTLAIIVCAFATWFLVALWKHLIFVRNIKEEGKGKTDTGKSQEQQSYEGCFVSLGYHAINTDDDCYPREQNGHPCPFVIQSSIPGPTNYPRRNLFRTDHFVGESISE